MKWNTDWDACCRFSKIIRLRTEVNSRSRSRSRTKTTAPAPAKKGGSGNPASYNWPAVGWAMLIFHNHADMCFRSTPFCVRRGCWAAAVRLVLGTQNKVCLLNFLFEFESVGTGTVCVVCWVWMVRRKWILLPDTIFFPFDPELNNLYT